MIDPCRMCYLYPDDCPTRNGCKSRINYLKLNGVDMSVIRKEKKSKGHEFYERGKKYEYNKNGIRREIR